MPPKQAHQDGGRAHRPPSFKSFLLVAAVLSMVAGIYGGLIRIGLPLPANDHAADLHGPIMICGVFGTLISLERAVALGWRWPYLAPTFSVAGTLLMLAGAPFEVGATLFVLAALALAAASIKIVLLQRALFTIVLVVGAAAWTTGNALFLLHWPVPDLAGWWLAFLICTISAERLELSRMLRPPRSSEVVFVVAIAILFLGAFLGILESPGASIFGIGLLVIVAWLVRNDIAMRTIRTEGQTRFFASAMLTGYFWLLLAAIILLAFGDRALSYDAVMHAVLIGFVISMVFAHALIILPAVTGARLRYHPALYAPLGVLQLSVVLRVAGDLLEIQLIRETSGILTAAALVSFAVTLVASRPRAPTSRLPQGQDRGPGVL